MYFAVYCHSSPDGLIPLTYRKINSDCLLLDQAALPATSRRGEGRKGVNDGNPHR